MHVLPSRFAPSTLVLAGLVCLLAASMHAGVNPTGFPPFPKKQYQPAGLGPKETDLLIEFPGGAVTRGVAKGNAVVSVMVDASGQPTDFLVVSCTDPSFGTALLEQAKTCVFQAAKFKGVAVPARFNLAYTFESKNMSMSAIDAARHRMDDSMGGKQAFSAAAEKDLDHPLEFTNVGLPRLPEGFPAPGSDPVKVFVTFYIDEQGRVREPNVESAVAPELIPGAVAAVLTWSFKPPTVKGKPALIFCGRAIPFVPRQSARASAGSAVRAD